MHENYDLELLLDLVKTKQFRALRAQLAEMNEVDIAEFLDELEPDQQVLVFRLLPKDVAADVFTYLEDSEDQEKIINALSDKELREVLDELYLDDTVDIIEDLPANMVSRILRNTDASTRSQINQLLKYPEDSAGSIMTTEFIYLHPDATVEESFARIRKVGLDKETVYTCYVTRSRVLEGVVTVKTLLLSDYETRIGDIMETNVISVGTHEDKEDVAQMFSKYDLTALPVVDGENRLVGIVTVDDAMDVMEEETTEDFEKMAAILPSDKPYLKTGVFETWKARIPWLLMLMLSATFSGMIITHFEGALAACVEVYFIQNLFDYSGAPMSLSGHVYNALAYLRTQSAINPAVVLLVALGMAFLLLWAAKRHEKGMVWQALALPMGAGMLLLTCYWGEMAHPYYALVFAGLCAPGLIPLAWLAGWAEKRGLLARALPLAGALAIVPVCMGLCRAVPLMRVKKADMAQTVFAEIMNREEAPTLLDITSLDQGFYLAAGIVPNCRYFADNNLQTQEKRDAIASYLAEGRTQFVVTRYADPGEAYELIAEADGVFDLNDMRHYKLYKRKEP